MQQQEAAIQPRSLIRFALVLIAAIGMVFLTTLLLARYQKLEPPPSAIGGPYQLVASDGRTVTEKTYLGKWQLIYFGYTLCPDACPTALNDMSAALQQLGATASQIQPIFITVDPKHDTRRVLADYIKAFDLHFVALTGNPDQTAAVAATYHIYAHPQSDAGKDDLIDHSAYIYVMDPQSRFVDVIDGGAPADQIAKSIETMMNRFL